MDLSKRIPEQESMINPEEVREYDRLCCKYLRKGYELVAEIVNEGEIPATQILDAGGGSGWLSITMAQRIAEGRILDVDISSVMLGLAKNNIDYNPALLNRIVPVCADLACLSCKDDVFDVAVSFASLHHWQQPIAIFRELQRVVKDRGRVVVVDLKRDGYLLMFAEYIHSSKFKKLYTDSVYASYTISELQQLVAEIPANNEIKVFESAMFVGVIWKIKK